MELIEKSGYLKLYSNSDGWQNVWVVLYQDSNLYLYKRKGDNDVKGKVYMKNVANRFSYGNCTDGLPDRPKLPKGQNYDNVLAIPQGNNSKAKIYWFLCSNQPELREWMDAICNTLPPSSPEKHHPQPQQEHDSQQVIFAPLPMKSGAPPPTKDDAPPPMKGDAPPPYPGPPIPAAEGVGCIGFEHFGGPSPPPAGYQPPPGGAAPYPTQQYANPYPQQGYQQPYFPPPEGYPLQQGYQQPYVQQGYYQQQPPPPAGYAYTQGQQYGYQQPGYAGQPNIVYVEEQPEKRTFGIFRGKPTCSSLKRSGSGSLSCFGNPNFGSFSKF